MPIRNPATSTNSDIYAVPITGGEAKKITISPAADNSPLYSPDGKFLASAPRHGRGTKATAGG